MLLLIPKDVFQYGQGRGIALKSTAQMTDVSTDTTSASATYHN